MNRSYQYLGFIMKRGYLGWYVLDWDYEHKEVVYGPCSERDARLYVERRS